jgi:hypothetical protein
MKTRNALIGYFILVLVAMTWVSWYACTVPTITSLPQYAAITGKEGLNVVDGYVTVCSEPWGLATMFDAYFGFLAFWIFVAWRERSGLSRGLWLVALMALGNFAIAGYALACLFTAPADASLETIFFTRKQA